MALQIPFHKAYTDSREVEALTDVIQSGWLTMGPKTFEFENEFAQKIGCSQAIAVSSCTAALHLALVAAGIGPGDEVIIPAMTFVATAEAVSYTGANVILCDVKKTDATIDPEAIERLISSKTRAIIPVHFGGTVCDMDSIMAIASRHNLTVIEDAAHALPSLCNGSMVGTIGDFTCFSFYATKTLTTGEGGMVTCKNEAAAERIRQLRLHGINKEAWNRYSKGGRWVYDVTETGFKYNMTDVQAALGLVQLAKLDEAADKRRRIAKSYDCAFLDNASLVPYTTEPSVESANHLYVLRLSDEASVNRDTMINHLTNAGIGTSVHYIPLYRFTSFKMRAYNFEDFPNCEWLYQRSLSLPIYPSMTEEETAHVSKSVLGCLQKGGEL